VAAGFWDWLTGKGDEAEAPTGPTPAEQAATLGAEALDIADQGRVDEARELLEQACVLDEEHPRYPGNLGNLLRATGDLDGALACYDRVVALRPDLGRAHVHRATTLNGLGRHALARDAASRALTLLTQDPDALYQRATAHRRLANADLALADLEQGLAARPADRRFILATAAVHKDQGRLVAAQALLEAGLEAHPQDADMANNLGTTRLAAEDVNGALAAFRQSIALVPTHAAALQNLVGTLVERKDGEGGTAHARALVALGRPGFADRLLLANVQHAEGQTDDAIDTLRHLLVELPGCGEAWTNLGVFQLARHDHREALAAFQQSARCLVDHSRPLEQAMTLPAHRLKHDLDQLDYLAARGPLSAPLETLRSNLADLVPGLPDGAAEVTLTPNELAPIRGTFNRILHEHPAPRLAGPALGTSPSWDGAEETYLTQQQRMVVIDEFLSPEALESLREFCRASTIWKVNFASGYVGATLREGFASPLLFQIAEELGERLPRIMEGHALQQSWAFKCDSNLDGVSLHADFAAVNLNFWITEDDANLDPEHGGLIVWDAPSPVDWSFQDYNVNHPKMRAFLDQAGAGSVSVPYRCNRALLFDSTYFHETDTVQFRRDYQRRRINVTMLFGRRLRRN